MHIDDPFGFETLLVLHRIWILLVLDVATRAVIGHALALANTTRNERALTERFFDLIGSNFAHRFPATTGTSLGAVERVLNDVGSNTSLMMTLDQFEDVIDVVLANYSGELDNVKQDVRRT